MSDEQMQPLLEVWLRDREVPRPKVQDGVASVIAQVPRTRQHGRWWPLPAFDSPRSTFPSRELAPAPIPATSGRQPARGFTMFSALKFVVAGVIVALFGGFLLAGVLTTQQEREVLPAAVTASPTTQATSEPTGAPTTSVRSDILPGVALTVEAVEPGVYRVVDDEVRDLASKDNLDIVAGHDGGIWLLRPQRFVRLGDAEWQGWPREAEVAAFEVAPDDTVWAMLVNDEGRHLYSVGRGSDEWTLTTDSSFRFEVTSDGTVWALWGDDPEDPDSLVFGYLGADGWQAVGEWPDWHPARGWCLKLGRCAFLVSDRGEVWALPGSTGPGDVQHFVDGAWRTYDGAADLRGSMRDSAVGADGTLWGSTRAGFFRFDGTEWTTFEWPEWMPTEGRLRLSWGKFHVAPDGALWAPVRPVEEVKSGVFRDVCDHGVVGVARFDGVTWDRYAPRLCVEAIDITADGVVWLLASEKEGRNEPLGLYVITPEAGAATE